MVLARVRENSKLENCSIVHVVRDDQAMRSILALPGPKSATTFITVLTTKMRVYVKCTDQVLIGKWTWSCRV
jgi:hypothetical protein